MYKKITTNGEFNDGFTGWTAGSDFSVVSEKAVWEGDTSGASATLCQTISSLEDGKSYEVWFSLSGIVWQGTPVGYVTVSLGGQVVGNYCAEGDYKVGVTAGSADNKLQFEVHPTEAADPENQDKVELDSVAVVYETAYSQQFPHRSLYKEGEEITQIVDTSEYQG